MLTLTLTLNNRQVTVCANEAQSHSFSLQDLRLNDAELKAFVLKPRLYGSRLFQALFKEGSAAKTAFDELSKQSARTIVLVLDSPELDGVAWEYAYNEVKQEYVVEDCAFTRALPESERPPNGRLKESVERVSLLFIPANPLVDLNAEPMRALDVDGEWREITRHITASHAPFDLLQLSPATPEQLQTSIARFRDGLAVHFSGHGAAMKDGTILLFERENGASNPLGTQEFIRAVKDKAEIVFLSACQSAAAEKTEFGNLARGLVKSGVPFALGMQFNLPDPFAPVISGQFYNWLAQGHAIPEATMQARRAVKRENEFFVGMIALYAAHPDETGKLNWRGSGTSLAQTFRPADVSDLPSPASGLIGRQHELMRIGTQLIEEKKPLTVTLHGAGGIGKTALLWQSLLRFAPSFELTLALALDPLPSLESILGRIERFLGLPSPCANETKEREMLVRERLTSKRTLLGLDNFETLNYALNEKDSDEEKTSESLHAFFKSLAANGVTLCVTSRVVTNLPGETIEDIQGLTNENGGRLFQENVVRQKGEIYIQKTQQISEMVGGHPLALRLLASAFDDQVGMSLDHYIEDLQSHLPKARDKWTEEDRHESLRASFDFTMNSLSMIEASAHFKNAVARLSVFISYFSHLTSAFVLENRLPDDTSDIKQVIENATTILDGLWRHSLLEKLVIESPEQNFFLYRIHPALLAIAKAYLQPIEENSIRQIYILSIRRLAQKSYDEMRGSAVLTQMAYNALPDLLRCTQIEDEEQTKSNLMVARLLHHFGQRDKALSLTNIGLRLAEKERSSRNKALALFQLADIISLQGNLNQGIDLYKKAKETFDSINDLRGGSAALNKIASIQVTFGNLDKAIELFNQVLSMKESIGDQQGISVALHNMAEVFVKRGDLDEAMNLYQRSLEIKGQSNNANGGATTLYAIANIHLLRGNFDEALDLYEQALEIKEWLRDLDGKSRILYHMARIKATQGSLDAAMDLYQAAMKIYDELGDIQGKSSTLRAMAEIYVIRGDLIEAIKLDNNSLELSRALGDLDGESVALFNIGQVYAMHGRLDEAMALYIKTLEINKKLNAKHGESATLHEMASIDATRGNVNDALTTYQRSLEISKKLNYLQGMSATMCAMANLHMGNGDLDKAIELYKQAIVIQEKLDDRKGKSAALHGMANVYSIQGERNKAFELYIQSLEIDDQLGNLRGKSAALHGIANIHAVNGNLEDAVFYYEQSLEIDEILGNLKSKSATLRNMGVIFHKQNQYAKALKFMLDSLELRLHLKANLDIESTISAVKNLKQTTGDESFESLWEQVTGNKQMPVWLVDSGKEQNRKI